MGLKKEHSEVEWTEISGFRNISIHEYFGVNLHIVYSIAKNDLPYLKKIFKRILKQF